MVITLVSLVIIAVITVFRALAIRSPRLRYHHADLMGDVTDKASMACVKCRSTLEIPYETFLSTSKPKNLLHSIINLNECQYHPHPQLEIIKLQRSLSYESSLWTCAFERLPSSA